jgi:hypothetical protein
MRNLTLDEKISIKGELAAKRVPRHVLVRLVMSEALQLYWRCMGKPAAQFNNSKRWHKKPRRHRA